MINTTPITAPTTPPRTDAMQRVRVAARQYPAMRAVAEAAGLSLTANADGSRYTLMRDDRWAIQFCPETLRISSPQGMRGPYLSIAGEARLSKVVTAAIEADRIAGGRRDGTVKAGRHDFRRATQ